MVKKQTVVWAPQPGRQTEALRTKAFELLYGGAKFGGKTQSGKAWLLKPFMDAEEGRIPREALRTYRALIIRKTSDDLKEWIDKAKDFYRPNGGEVVGRPAEIRFKCGAIFWTGHLRDANSYTKYLGWNIPRMLLEELELIPSEELYIRLLGACRSPNEWIDPRVFCTCNPGDVGNKWITNRWGIKGSPPYDTVVTETPRGKRVFIPARAEDNPIGMKNDPGYALYLQDLPTLLRKAWWEGDFTAFAGQSFTLSEQIHGIESFDIPYDWPLWAGLDYGEVHPCAFGSYAPKVSAALSLYASSYCPTLTVVFFTHISVPA